jgi:hypothetical protein
VTLRFETSEIIGDLPGGRVDVRQTSCVWQGGSCPAACASPLQ